MTDYQPAQWQIDQTHPHHHQDLVEGLSGLVDQEIGYSFIELGLIRDIKLEDGEAHVTMVLTTPFCPYGPEMLSDAELWSKRFWKCPPPSSLAANTGIPL